MRFWAALAFLLFTPTVARASSLYDVYVVWLAGQGDTDRAHLDDFFGCLLFHSNFLDFWNGQVFLNYRGSFVVPAPANLASDGAAAPWLTQEINAGHLPVPTQTPLYVVIGNAATLTFNACGVNAPETVHGINAGVALVKTSCWVSTTALRNETSIGEHELAEIIDGMLGHDRCAGDCQCEGLTASGQAAPQNFTGLSCAGAPASTVTGAGNTVSGWVVQKLSHQGETTCTCELTCDFTVSLACGGQERVNAPCMQDSDCCTDLVCRGWSYTGNPPFGTACCKPVGATCATGTDCCGGSACNGGHCACVPDGQWCLNADECCSGDVCDLMQHKCLPAPPPDASVPPDAPIGGGGSGGSPDAGNAAVGDGGGCSVGGSVPNLSWSVIVFLIVATMRLRPSRNNRLDREDAAVAQLAGTYSTAPVSPS